MEWHQQLYNVLTHVNNVVLFVIGIPFLLQLIYMLLFWVPKKKFPVSEKKNRLCVLICAHNEEDVIGATVADLISRQNYPKELFDIYVVAHNCTDRTAEIAREAGATVFVLDDPDESRHIVSYALKFGYESILATGIDYAFSLRFDADNHVNDDFFSLMNDAWCAGVKIARPYESALNMTQNNFTMACGLYYIFDSRFGSRVRERLHLDAHVNGPGSMTDFDIIRKIGGYDTISIVEDTEFCFKRMIDGYRCHFVEDAVVYEDLPSSFKDTLNRNKRIASGNVRLLAKYAPKLTWNAIKQFRFSFIEQIMTYFFMIIALLLCTWIPAYYIYAFSYLGANGVMHKADAAAAGLVGPGFWELLTIVGLCVGILFLFAGILQGLLLVMFEYKKMGAKRRRDLIPGVLLFPAFTIVYCVTMAIGLFCKPTWAKINRNTGTSAASNASGEQLPAGDDAPAQPPTENDDGASGEGEDAADGTGDEVSPPDKTQEDGKD